MTTSHLTNGNGNGNVNGNGHGHAAKDSSRYWIKPYVPNQGESFEDAKARFATLIRDEDVAHWHEHGYVIIERFLSPEEMEGINEGVHQHMPTSDEIARRELVFGGLMGTSSRNMKGSSAAAVRYDFPYDSDALNNLAMHPFLLAFAERLAETDDLALSLGHLGEYDQALHSDYSNNSLVIPQESKRWIDIPMIVYLTDVTPDLGPTYVVSQTHTEPRKLMEDGFRHHTRQDFPELYDVEVPALVPAGSVIIYSMRTFHRGSAMTADRGHRFVQFTGYHTANPEMDRFLVNADPRQRQIVGFPGVEHDYWKERGVVEAVGKRYPQMDMRPYGGGPPLASRAD
ncbi:hypothetical protein EHS25_006144 [Saitozyma podzolica]|uniref:Phytanoyl-CoA dioxygenase n=1 Tax=Saitozyma podzolica TaxID=1890683 RepID=A0A427XRJ1_9TREE|nr:hypothetical protein EHS25_006144 [Saitozyma podzolica]